MSKEKNVELVADFLPECVALVVDNMQDRPGRPIQVLVQLCYLRLQAGVELGVVPTSNNKDLIHISVGCTRKNLLPPIIQDLFDLLTVLLCVPVESMSSGLNELERRLPE